MERKNKDKTYSSARFAGRIFCGDCGGVYGPKVWHSKDKYKRTIWQCNDKFKAKDSDGNPKSRCKTTHLDEERIEELFCQAFSQYFEHRDEIISEMQLLKETCFDDSKIRKSLDKVRQDMEITASALKQCIAENASASVSEAEFRERYDGHIVFTMAGGREYGFEG